MKQIDLNMLVYLCLEKLDSKMTGKIRHYHQEEVMNDLFTFDIFTIFVLV